MVILHIATIRSEALTGVAVAVPQHVNVQGMFAQVGFVNVAGDTIPGIKNQFPYGEKFLISNLPEPFCKPNLIVFHEVYRPAFLKLYKQAKAANIPYIIIPHGCLTREAQRKKRLKKVAANFLLFNAFINRAAAIQFLSEQERRDSRFGKNKILGSNGVFLPEARKRDFSIDSVRLVYIGRTEVRIKGLDLMLEAVFHVGDTLRGEEVNLSLYGPDMEGRHDELRGLIARLQIGDLVELNGAITGEEKKAVLLDADVFIQTSRSEGMPMGILEAMSYGLPCLVTRGTRLGEIIERYDAGWVAETDSRSIAETILKMLNERDRWEEKSRNVVKLIEENFQWNKVAQATVAEYRRIIREN